MGSVERDLLFYLVGCSGALFVGVCVLASGAMIGSRSDNFVISADNKGFRVGIDISAEGGKGGYAKSSSHPVQRVSVRQDQQVDADAEAGADAKNVNDFSKKSRRDSKISCVRSGDDYGRW